MEICLCGYKVLIDEEDYEKVMRFSWFVDKTNLNQGLIYFCHGTTSEKMRLHRYILGCIKNDKNEVDHKNGNTLDNRKQNLRVCSHSQNSKNAKRSKNNKTGYKGVSWHKRDCCYQARIGVNMKRVHLGYYNTPEEAYAAYCEASKKYHGEYGRVK